MIKNNYKIFGNKPVEIVVEMGLGACISEWMPMGKLLAEKLENQCGILLYERAGINKSEESKQPRTPQNIASELFDLLKQVEHTEKIILLAHSQGGLYAQTFCRKYPQMVRGVVFLDPLSAEDNLFKEKLSTKEYKMSGVDKSMNFKLMKILAKCHLGGVTKKVMRKAPPFYYYDAFTSEETKEILDCTGSAMYAETALNEYLMAHEEKNVINLKEKGDFPDIPLMLITHACTPAIEESMLFGNNTREFATKIEDMWQDIMKKYLTFSSKAEWMQATKSTHYIHLMEPEIILTALQKVLN